MRISSELPRAVDFTIYQAPIEMTEMGLTPIRASYLGEVMFPKEVESHRKYVQKLIKKLNKPKKEVTK